METCYFLILLGVDMILRNQLGQNNKLTKTVNKLSRQTNLSKQKEITGIFSPYSLSNNDEKEIFNRNSIYSLLSIISHVFVYKQVSVLSYIK